MRIRWLLVWLVVQAATLPLAAGAPAAERDASRSIRVFAAASLADAFTEIGRRYQTAHPGASVQFNFAGSQQLATQIEHGASVDLFASADERWMRYVEERSLLRGSPVILARNQLVAIVPRTNPARIRDLRDLAKRGVKLVLGAGAVPVGAYSRQVLENLSRDPSFGDGFARRALANVVSEEENVRSVVGKVQLGEADAGMVYRSDVSPRVARFVRVLEIPADANVIASYPMAVLAGVRDAPRAQAFLEMVLSPEGQEILQRHGLMAAPVPVAR